MNLNQINNFITEQFSYYEFKEELSRPLLVTTDETYKKNVQNKILYIGQETNGWGSHRMEFDDIEEERNYIERVYYNFLYKKNATGKDFWRFIKNTIEIEETEIKNNVIWSNAFIAGKKDDKGITEYNHEISEISIKYLTFLYEYFEPRATIIVSGPKSPYLENINIFLENIGKKIEKPNIKEPLRYDEDVYWTYHPTFLNKKNMSKEVSEKIKKLIR